ncbi:hypothetical protein LshimejAT787_1104470 [Lyophyllum shimeji]|uniref:F-box domain-containing protein n=1 Tax=Lyophyllum shimeji TaxID=47721 RepID=A0A9P3URP1_LYOSH|nr:hypothetical protein LshimejAT787_1104470 [Lyophyllum shimeji]
MQFWPSIRRYPADANLESDLALSMLANDAVVNVDLRSAAWRHALAPSGAYAVLTVSRYIENPTPVPSGPTGQDVNGPLGLTDCPYDVLLHIAAQLELRDIFNVLQTCSSLQRLGEIPSLWLEILQRTALSRPIACPTGTDFRQLETHDLQHIAGRTNRLQRN